MTITSLHGDNLDILPTLAPGSVQALICSPPYYGLRSYSIPPSSWPAVEYTPLIGLPPVVVPPVVCQLGAESDPLAYIGHLVHVFRLARPALRRDGTLWINLGDSYSGGKAGRIDHGTNDPTSRLGPKRAGIPNGHAPGPVIPRTPPDGFREKSLLGIPARAALALQADGWVWRNDIIWHAPNKMPESVRDRFTRAHEDVLLFGNSARYYFDSDAVAEDAAQPNGEAQRTGQNRMTALGHNSRTSTLGSNQGAATRNRRDVWSIPTTPMPAHLRGGDEAHYAAWPPALVEIIVKAASANKACGECGAAWVRQVEREPMIIRRSERREQMGEQGRTQTSGTMLAPARSTTLGFSPACQCAAQVGRCVILDPFAGTGTTLQVAESLGRDSIGIDLGYQTLQERRTNGIQVTMDALL